MDESCIINTEDENGFKFCKDCEYSDLVEPYGLTYRCSNPVVSKNKTSVVTGYRWSENPDCYDVRYSDDGLCGMEAKLFKIIEEEKPTISFWKRWFGRN